MGVSNKSFAVEVFLSMHGQVVYQYIARKFVDSRKAASIFPQPCQRPVCCQYVGVDKLDNMALGISICYFEARYPFGGGFTETEKTLVIISCQIISTCQLSVCFTSVSGGPFKNSAC